MKRFKEFLIEDISVEKNSHLIHAEDLPILKGTEGLDSVITFLDDIIKQLAGGLEKVQVKTKWDGCIHEDSILITKNGLKSIGDIIKEDKREEVLTLNLNTEEEEFNLAIKPRMNFFGKKWIEVFLENGQSIKTTEDHEFFTKNRGWVMAKDLTEDDDILDIKISKFV